MTSPRHLGKLPLPLAGEGRGDGAGPRIATPSTCERPALAPTLSRQRERGKARA